MNWRRRDLLLATGLTLVFGSAANARILVEENRNLFIPSRSKFRRIHLRHAHTGEVFNGPYRDQDGPLADALVDLSIFLRDHHENKPGPIFIATLDFLADVMESAGQGRATVLSAFRTKRTNAMLATRIFGVAEKSQHLAGRAIDITLDSKLSQAATSARKMSRGGVGWYPHSHFVHLDSGPVRNWTMQASDGDRLLARLRPRKPLTEKDREQMRRELRPLTVSERLRLQRALAKKQLKERTK